MFASTYSDGSTVAYEYDALNNRTKEIYSNGDVKDYAYNEKYQLSEIKLNGVVIDTYTYNETGAVVTHNNETYTYNEWDKLSEYSDGTDIYTYKYDANGIRTGKNDKQYVIDINNNVIAETDSTGAITDEILWGHQPLARKTNGTWYYYIYNAHGDVVGLVNDNGTVVNTYEYTPWGEIRSESETVDNPIKYAGEYQDLCSGLIYLRNRYYDPSIGRFISEDPIRHGTNWYIYANNNPVMFIDPTGLIPSLEDAAEMASRSYNTYDMSRSGLESRKLGNGWRLIDEWKGSEGLVIHIYVRGDGEHSSYTGAKEYAFVNKGSSTWGDWANNFQQPFGWSTDMSESIAKAEYFANGDWGNYEITFIGHSKGGAEAAANAVATNRNAILFNPAATALNEYGLNANTYSADMTVYFVKGESLNALNSLLGAKAIDNYKPLPFYSWNPIKNHSMEAVKNGVKGR